MITIHTYFTNLNEKVFSPSILVRKLTFCDYYQYCNQYYSCAYPAHNLYIYITNLVIFKKKLMNIQGRACLYFHIVE